MCVCVCVCVCVFVSHTLSHPPAHTLFYTSRSTTTDISPTIRLLYDINELKPIYAAYSSADLEEGRSSWTLKQAIVKRLLQHAGSNEEIVEEEECKQAVGKRLLEHAGSKEELIEEEGRSSTGTEQTITKK